MKENKKDNSLNMMVKINLAVDIAVFILAFLFLWFSSEISEVITIILVGLIFLLVMAILFTKTIITIVLNIIAIGAKLKNKNHNMIFNIVATMISVLLLIVAYTFDFELEKVKFEHFLYQSQREQEISEIIDNGTENMDNSILWKTLDDGEILKGYWVQRGMLSGYSLLYYTSVDDPEIVEKYGGGAEKTVLAIEKIDEHWYYARFE